MRGYVYEVSDNVDDNLHCLDSDDLCQYIGQEADYFADLPKQEIEDNIESLIKYLDNFGAETGEEEGVSYFIITDDVRRAYFSKRYDEFMGMVKDLSLDDFINEDYTLRHIISDEYSNMVYSESDGLRSMDYFIRNAEPDTKYYLGNVILAH